MVPGEERQCEVPYQERLELPSRPGYGRRMVRAGALLILVLFALPHAVEGEKVDLIVSITTSVTLAAKRATKSVPIVFYAGTYPVFSGLVSSQTT